jgi:hypothetical protein
MDSPRMTPLSRRSTTSKLRFIGDGTYPSAFVALQDF